MRRQLPWQIVVLMTCVLLVMPASVSAQEATGKVLGTVTDEKGSLVPGANITVTNTATQISRETTTDKDGTFEVLSLPIGSYQVMAEHAGFKKYMSEAERLEINRSLRIDIKMEVGSPTETVTVSSAATLVETVNPTLGQSVTARPLLNLPLNGRNIYDLALLMPGVTEKNPDATGQAGSFSIAGSKSDSVTFLLDGGTNNNLLSNAVAYTPNPDTIQEFRILTSNYTAEYGRNGGGILSVVTKSGTNQFHVSAFEFVRNNAFNANSFFNKRNNLPKEILKRNQFGFTVGGPILIPKVVHGKDKYFFFASYAGQRQVKTDTTASVPVFTPAELKGDFSRSNPSRTGPDPGVVTFLQGFPFFQPNAALAAQGIIDPSRVNSISQKYISNNLFPTSPTGQLVSQGGSKNDNDEVTLKFDAAPRPNDRFAATLGAIRNPQVIAFDGSNVSGFPSLLTVHRYFANISYTKVFSPDLLNEFRFTAQRVNQVQAVPGKKLPTAAELGIGITPDNPTGPPRMGFVNGLNIGFSPQGPTTLINNTFVTSDTVSWIKGKHSWKFGYSYSPYQNNTVFDFFVNGEFDFNGASGGIGTSNPFADFLLGLPDQFTQFPEAPSDIRSKTSYGFAQDEWRIHKNLTLTLGLRYEYSQPKIDTRGRSFSLEQGRRSTVFTKAPVGLLFPGDPTAPKGANFADKNDWAPRFGFAWVPRGNTKMSVRGGFGVFYDILKGEDNLQFNGQAPFFGTTGLAFNPLAANPSVEVNYLSRPFIATGVANPFPSKPPAPNLDFVAAGFTPFGIGGVFFVDPHLRTPYTYQYNLSVQREIIRNLVVEAAYVGSSSHKLTALVDANPFILGTTNRVFNTTPGNSTCTTATPFSCSFAFLDEFQNVVTAHYNSLQLSATKRVSENRFGSTYFTFAYTYGHSIDNSSGFRGRLSRVPAYDTQRFHADSNYDIRHRISFGGGWDLPFDRLWASGPSRLTRGWSLYPIVSYRTGFPLDVLAQLSRSVGQRPGPSAAGDGSIVHANLAGSGVTIFDPKLSQTLNSRTGNFWFSPTDFNRNGLSATSLAPVTDPTLRTYGTVPRNFFRGPSRTNVNFAVAKDTPIKGERFKVGFRAEFFNLFNTAQFDNPSTTITSSLFGQITTTADPRIVQFAVKLIY